MSSGTSPFPFGGRRAEGSEQPRLSSLLLAGAAPRPHNKQMCQRLRRKSVPESEVVQ